MTLAGQVEVELHLALRGAGEEEEAAGVPPHLLDHVRQGDDLARALGELDHLAPLAEGDQLVDDDRQPVRLDADGLHGGLHPADVPLVVGAPDVDHAIEPPAHELVVVVGDVRGEVARDAVAADQDVVLVVPQGGAGEPHRPLALDDVPPLAEEVDHPLHLARVVQGLLPEPDVVADAQGVHVRPVQGHDPLHGDPGELRDGLVVAQLHERVAVLRRELAPEVGQEDALVAVLGHLRRVPQGLQVAGQDGLPQGLQAAPGVVDQVLPLHLPAGEIEQVGQGVSQAPPRARCRRGGARWGWPRRTPPAPAAPGPGRSPRSGRRRRGRPRCGRRSIPGAGRS